MKVVLVCLVLACLPLQGFSQYKEMDWKERDTWMALDTIFSAIGVEKGDRVADIGCHEGYLSVRLAKKIGKKGKVYAVDLRTDRLQTLKDISKERKLDNIKTIVGDYDNPNLPKGRLDTVIIMDTYHEITDYMTVLGHVKSALKPGGQIVIIEKLKSRIKGKSRDEQTDAHSLGPKYVEQELRKAGFTIRYENNDLGDWENDPDKVIWMLIATKAK
ncbi:methyltransferase domain-containing protein [uncultured Psychroserpens sp.]|uniref:class I SAM-dependent methyltransferase n=1 Tax=uncultured Psychroserpens sp. TaxID=255436 RepID=UPI0026274895|nr:methyltransferase domain-containing protein [uncultured Psychroserpens sp.]